MLPCQGGCYMGNVIYSKGSFIIFLAGDNCVVYNKEKDFECGHSHLKSIKAGKDAITFVMAGKIPKNCRNYYLITLQRLSTDETYINKIQELMDVRKQKGKTLSYRNCTGFRKR